MSKKRIHKEFIREAKKYIPDVTATDGCRRIAEELGARFRVREYDVVG